MDTTYYVVLIPRGESGDDLEALTQRIQEALNIPEDKASHIARQPFTILKRGLDQDLAERIAAGIEKLGCDAAVVEDGTEFSVDTTAATSTDAPDEARPAADGEGDEDGGETLGTADDEADGDKPGDDASDTDGHDAEKPPPLIAIAPREAAGKGLPIRLLFALVLLIGIGVAAYLFWLGDAPLPGAAPEQSTGSQTADPDKKATPPSPPSEQTVFAEDGKVQITIPGHWSPSLELDDNAIIEVGLPGEELYFIVVRHRISDIRGYDNPEQIARFVSETTASGLENGEITQGAEPIKIGDIDGTSYEITGGVSGGQVTFRIAYLATDEYFYQLRGLTLSEQFAARRELFNQIIASFRDHGIASR